MSVKDVFRFRGDKYFEATEFSPSARNNERAQLLSLVKIKAGDRICDLQSAAGYVPDGIFDLHGDSVNITCVEPSLALSKNILPRYDVINCELESLKIGDATHDIVLTLAGTHHSRSLKEIVSESHRILKPGGQMAFAEVEVGSAMDEWLNGFCDKWTIDGHKGKFVNQGDFAAEFENRGLLKVSEFVGLVPWVFNDFDQMVTFCKKLFGLSKASKEVVADGIRNILPIEIRDNEAIINWSLVYCSGQKAEAA